MQVFYKIVLCIAIVGAINWGLIGLFDFKLITTLISNKTIVRVLYGIVGVCGLISIGLLFKDIHDN